MFTSASLWALLSSQAFALSAGDVVISEISIAPAADVSEWFEVVNRTGASVDLAGCTLYEGSGAAGDYANWGHSFVVNALVIPGGQRGVLMNNDGADTCVAYTSSSMTTCGVPPDILYNTLSFNNTGTERLALVCGGAVIDEISYSWTPFAAECPLAGNKNCSVALRENRMNASDNDDWSSDTWCVSTGRDYIDEAGTTARGTPREANQCPEIMDRCGAGEVVITELMIDPPDGYKEFIELYGASSDCNLSGCELREGPSSDGLAAEDWAVVTLEGNGANLPIAGGDHLLLARSSDWIAGQMSGGTFVGSLAADYSYSGISFSNTSASWLHLVCDGAIVDSAPVDWQSLVALCPGENCSANLSPSSYTASANNAVSAWCVPPADDTWVNPAGETIVATPGQRGACVSLNWPDAGEVIFTEALISPQGDVPEYLEVKNISGSSLEISYCTLRRFRTDEGGAELADSVKTAMLGSGETLEVEVGESQLLSYNRCLLPDENGNCPTESFYSTVQLSAGEAEHLQLLCDGLLIDEVVLAHDEAGIRAGHAMMLDANAESSTLNDDPTNWCEAAFSQNIAALCFTDEGDCNYGSPGAANECLTERPTPPDPVVRCAAVSGLGAGWAGIGALLIGFRRRKGQQGR